MTQMNRILRLSVEDMDVTVQAGVTRRQLDEKLRPEGVFFSVDPGADASIGGMVATGASGTTSVRYGTMRENVLSLTVVTADGEVVRTRSRARKSSAGYDLTRLFVGCEGTLGLITEITLRLQPTPEAMTAATAAFPTPRRRGRHRDRGPRPRDPGGAHRAARRRADRRRQPPLRARPRRRPHALVRVPRHARAETQAQAAEVGEIAEAHGVQGFDWAADETERRALWRPATAPTRPAARCGPAPRASRRTRACPSPRLAETINETKQDLDASGLVAPIVGHVGDGNFHLAILVDPDDPDEMRRAVALNDRLVHRAIAADGTCTGEHGVGYGKAAFLELEHGPAALAMMRAIKSALDPEGLFNPGKVAG